MVHYEERSTDLHFAWMHLTMLCGCNYKQPVERRGRSVYVKDPQGTKSYRLDAAQFDAGQRQHRDSWTIEPWSDYAAQISHNERDWMD